MYTGLQKKWPLFFFQILMNVELVLHIFKKSSNIKYDENPSSGCRLVLSDGHANSRLSHFCQRAHKSQYCNMTHEIASFFFLKKGQRRVWKTINHDRLKRGLPPVSQELHIPNSNKSKYISVAWKFEF